MTDRFDLKGRRVLVTGASSGLGEHFALMLASAGARVVAAARRVERLQALVARIGETGGHAQALELDVADAASVAAAFASLDETGGIDVVVNNAGVTVAKSALKQTEADWDSVIDTNLKGAWLVATEAARRWVAAQRPGTIVNVASILGERVAGAVAPYAISKAGVLQLTKALALEFARHDIRVNALAPGYVSTDLNRDFLASEAGQRLQSRVPQGRFSDPEDLDGALLLLASDAGRSITGAVLAVDGGHLVSSL
ncbi:SDR family NAD(P)-dependent oxidoreductase [Paraburkholderia bannensis]|uniref:SDR family NAD(P)-dependent oxidoreductase n=1 Tax=Paraburkholderia bannensis TaxID=765414 RepID=UPI002AC31C82|nr:glucose 1-dehydrogenase [Paraburkholderia bannensis]